MTRFQTDYPGVFYREVGRIGGKGPERAYYIVFKKNDKVLEEKVGRQYADQMIPAKAARIRADRVEGCRKSRQELRDEAKVKIFTTNTIGDKYKEHRTNIKGMVQDENRFKLHITPTLGKKQPSDLVPLDIDRLRISLNPIRDQDDTVFW
jgi:hypothetical protein